MQLVEAGFTGQRDGIGFTYGTVIADGFDPQRYVQGLGRDWLILAGLFQAALLGALSARRDRRAGGGACDAAADRLDVARSSASR